MIHGFLAVDKPKGMTSFDVVGILRKTIHQKKIGHLGTLDPNATGVLPVALGDATRLINYLSQDEKKYRADIYFGYATDTFDITGEVTLRDHSPELNAEIIEKALGQFRGEITQVPPIYSAIKVNGRRLYDYARNGEDVEIKPRQVFIHDIRLNHFKDNIANIDVHCSKGTYIRSIANDLGQALGTLSCMGDLRRLQSGPFQIDQALDLEKLRSCPEEIENNLIPATHLLNLPTVAVKESGEKFLRNGSLIPLRYTYGIAEEIPEGHIVSLSLNHEQRLYALGKVAKDRFGGPAIQPFRVFKEPLP